MTDVVQVRNNLILKEMCKSYFRSTIVGTLLSGKPKGAMDMYQGIDLILLHFILYEFNGQKL